MKKQFLFAFALLMLSGRVAYGQGQNFPGGGGGLKFVASLPATCTPGVTASVQLSVAPYAIYYCSATNTWSPSSASGSCPALTTGTGGVCMVGSTSAGWSPTAGDWYIRGDTTSGLFACSTNGAAEASGCGFLGPIGAPSIALTGSAPAITTPGTTPYLNLTAAPDRMYQCNFALTTSTLTLAASPVSLCSIALPNAAVVWRVSCQGGYSVTAGTTPTFAVGNTWANAASNIFAAASILTTNTGTGTQGTVTATGNILATGSLSIAATIFQANWWTVFTGNGSAGNYSPTASLTGTGATGTLVGFCTIQ